MGSGHVILFFIDELSLQSWKMFYSSLFYCCQSSKLFITNEYDLALKAMGNNFSSNVCLRWAKFSNSSLIQTFLITIFARYKFYLLMLLFVSEISFWLHFYLLFLFVCISPDFFLHFIFIHLRYFYAWCKMIYVILLTRLRISVVI